VIGGLDRKWGGFGVRRFLAVVSARPVFCGENSSPGRGKSGADRDPSTAERDSKGESRSFAQDDRASGLRGGNWRVIVRG